MNQRVEMSGAANAYIELMRHTCTKGHYWETEQHSTHRVCSWCNACDVPACSSYDPDWQKREES
jgi:hypothetical protein